MRNLSGIFLKPCKLNVCGFSYAWMALRARNASPWLLANFRDFEPEQGVASRANTTPNGGPHLELGRLRLKTWSKSDFSIAETTWPTYRYIYFYKHKNRSASSFFLGGGCDERRSQMVIHVECTTTSYQVTNKRPNGSWLTNLLNLLAPIGWGPPAS